MLLLLAIVREEDVLKKLLMGSIPLGLAVCWMMDGDSFVSPTKDPMLVTLKLRQKRTHQSSSSAVSRQAHDADESSCHRSFSFLTLS